MRSEPQSARTLVWALPISLAATLGIDVSFSSSAYLDVSVQRVSPHIPIYSVYDDRVLLCRVSPFGHPRIYSYLHLPVAFRSLSRPSSAPNAKAFSMRSSSLDLVVASFARFAFASRKSCALLRSNSSQLKSKLLSWLRYLLSVSLLSNQNKFRFGCDTCLL